MAEIFGVTRQNIDYHIAHIYNGGELDKSLTSKDCLLFQKADNHWIKKSTIYYNFDMISSIGYRINLKEVTRFK